MEPIHLVDLNRLDWQPHPIQQGVETKIIETRETQPLADTFLARVLPGGQIQWHVHEQASETVYVVRGLGTLLSSLTKPDPTSENTTAQSEMRAGIAFTVRAGVWHSVFNRADEPLILFAFHTPPTF